jgi:hypothetical protein
MMMKIKLLVVAAGLMALPVMGHAQTPTDTTMKMGKDTMKTMTHKTRTAARKRSAAAKDEATESAKTKRAEKAEASESKTTEKSETMAATTPTGTLPDQSVNGPRPVPPSDGTTCPWKCPTSKGIAGLTGPQFLALQQELRDKGCGTNHVTGWLDGATRHAVGVCAKKLGVANNAGAVLVAMNIGYGASDVSMGKM